MKYDLGIEGNMTIARMAIRDGWSRTKFATAFGMKFYEADILFRKVLSEE